MHSFHFDNLFYFLVILTSFVTHISIFAIYQLDAIFSQKNKFKSSVFFTYDWICIHYHAFIIILFGIFHEYFFLKYDYYYPLIPYTLILPRPGSLIHQSIITPYINNNTDNSHNKFAHVYYLQHPYAVSYIILLLLNKFS